MRTIYAIFIAAILVSCGTNEKEQEKDIPVGTLEVVAELELCPGNVALSKDGRIFMTTHAMRGDTIQLFELLDSNKYEPFPDITYQTNSTNKAIDKLDTPLGVFIDKKDRLWTIDAGFGLGLTGRLFCFDINTKKELHRFDIPKELTPSHSCAQDLAVDEKNDWIYISDSGDPGIITLDVSTGEFRKFQDSTMLPEDIEMVIDGDTIKTNGQAFKIGMNPISISDDRNNIYYGAMNGTKWYSIPSKLFRENAADSIIQKAIKVEGPKPFCDGVSTSTDGKHYFSNMQNHSIDVLDEKGELSTLVKDERIDWPDNVRVGPDGWLYISANQLYKAPPFTGGEDEATKPYYVLRVKL